LGRNIPVKCVYASDLHENEAHYEALRAYADRHRASAILIGGDLLPKHCAFERSIGVQRAFAEDELVPWARDFTRSGPGRTVYLMMGNDDWATNMDVLEDANAEGWLRLLHERVYPLTDDLFVCGYGCVPITPFSVKDWERLDVPGEIPFSWRGMISREGRLVGEGLLQHFRDHATIQDDLARLASRVDPSKTIFIAHAPPYGTHADALYDGSHVGSKALRSFIRQHQPPATFHGHIHEAPAVSGRWLDHLGKTIVVGPGQAGNRLHAVAFDTDDLRGSLEHSVYSS
jgi:Icc-related predicted phosphoesterase